MKITLWELRQVIQESLRADKIRELVRTNRQLFPRLGKEVGDGTEGVVYASGAGQVVKVCSLPEAKWRRLEGVLRDPPEGAVPVTGFGAVARLDNGDVLYWYSMPRLKELPPELWDELMFKKDSERFRNVNATGHTDLGPSNVMLMPDGTPAAIDLEGMV